MSTKTAKAPHRSFAVFYFLAFFKNFIKNSQLFTKYPFILRWICAILKNEVEKRGYFQTRPGRCLGTIENTLA